MRHIEAKEKQNTCRLAKLQEVISNPLAEGPQYSASA